MRVVVPAATPQVRSWSQSKAIEWQQRPFQPDDLEGMFLVVAATSSAELHERLFELARSAACSATSSMSLLFGDFYHLRGSAGALQIAISTAGQSPALAQRLRKQLEDQFGPEYEEWLTHLGDTRDKLFSSKMDPEERKRLLHEAASAEAFESFLRNRAQSKRSG